MFDDILQRTAKNALSNATGIPLSGDAILQPLSWGQRIKGSVGSIVIGFFLLIASFILLFWNEGRAVTRYKALKEGANDVVSVFPERVVPTYEGQLVCLSGLATTKEVLEDSVFQVKINGLKLSRTVEMYQWLETVHVRKEKGHRIVNGEKIYSYTLDWREGHVNSSGFHEKTGHENPPLAYQEFSWYASDVNIGAFQLNRNQIERITKSENVKDRPPAEQLRKTFPNIIETENGYYIGNSLSAPQLGDLRISFKYVPQTEVSVVAQQIGNSFRSYQTESVEESIDLLEHGLISAKLMFKHAQNINTYLTWGLRVLGFGMIFLGLTLMMNFLVVLADIVPAFGSIVGLGVGLIAFVLTLVLSLTTVGIAWFYYRPILSISLFATATVALVSLKFMKTKKMAPV